MKLPRRKFLHLAAGAAVSPALPRITRAESYPTRPVRIVVASPAGGTFDIIGRLVAQWLSARLGQQFVVENRGGAGTNLGTGAVAHSAPDGYTLLILGSPAAINETLYSNLDFNVSRDIAPIAAIETAPLIMVVNPAQAIQTVPEFISYVKANAGRVNMGSGGIGSTGHVAGELFNMMAGIKITHVPYRGEPPAVTDLLGGQVQVVFSTPGSVISSIKGGKLRALAVTSAKRMEVLPDVPTVAEFLAGYEANSWAGLAAPSHTSAEIIETLNQAVNAGLADAKLKDQLAGIGAVVMPGSTADFTKFIATETEKWAKVVKFANIKLT
jgi:tripartite-type tricarboxylate transporter receptor subunit TctC